MRLRTLAALSTVVLWSLCPPTASTLDTPSQPPVRATAPTLGEFRRRRPDERPRARHVRHHASPVLQVVMR